MAESSDVLNGLIIVYTCYAVVIISLIAWFGYKISRKGEGKLIRPGLFYTWVGFLVVLGVSLHILTYNTIPWAPMDLNRVDIKPDTVIYITVADHEFRLPGEKITLKKDQKVLFDVTSMDLTYGFGLFRSDHSMVFQMQVIPGHKNDIFWQFPTTGVFTIRSTEYSGPKGTHMELPDAVEIIE